MHAPQIILLCLWGIGLLLMARLHGNPMKGTHSFPIALVRIVVFGGLLWWGGFFG